MRIFRSFEEAKGIRNAVVTTGTFDGVHIGHKAIINRLNRLAEEVQGESVLITFHPHPRKVLYPESEGHTLRMILTQEEKIQQLKETGLHNLLIIPFTKDFSSISSFSFVTEYLLGKLHAKVIVVGYNHHFGHNREGNYAYLHQLSKSYGFQVEEIPVQEIQNESVSSTKIRKALQEGNIQRANAYLDHLYRITGTLAEGNPVLGQNGFATYFLHTNDRDKLIPPSGVYAVRVNWNGNGFKAICNIRYQQEAMEILPSVEFHLLEEAPILTPGTSIILFFHKRIRDLMQFSSVKDLLHQLMIDREIVNELIY